MELVITDNATEAGVLAGRIMADHVRRGARAIGLATGSSPLGAYQELIRQHREEGLSFAGVQAFLLDEYIGLPAGHPQSYAQFIRDEFTAQVDFADADVHSPDGRGDDIPAAAADYERMIALSGPVSVQILGIGANGHLGFNEPGSSLRSRTRVKTLTPKTREDNARFFDGDLSQVPTHVLTQGLGTISDADHLVMIATGEGKADAVAAAVEGPVSAFCPASILQMHPHVTVIVDPAAAVNLKAVDYYRFAVENKPSWQRF
ncbi:glucosamine-6-phosphate deaminase [Nocardia otitidiscaviarum]|uniref:glucosamine-6-phosphate deaminase n=1 Tax=Nocardia otitidiscaviarum TaxID=1823 RepID=UPI0018960D2A|nr:glucosamine-6-phosphate deaminase [Nocardia otitidiscaviarum]MBF6180894.1 glucosamine-6-phosphate deaminase [Nocardia otitidiscaviarum]